MAREDVSGAEAEFQVQQRRDGDRERDPEGVTDGAAVNEIGWPSGGDRGAGPDDPKAAGKDARAADCRPAPGADREPHPGDVEDLRRANLASPKGRGRR